LRFPAIAAATAAGLLIGASTAHAGIVTLDAPCYVEQSEMVASGIGFTPGSQLTLSGDGLFGTAQVDAAGAFRAALEVPLNPSSDARKGSIITYTLQVQDPADAAQDTTAQYQVTNFAYGISTGVTSPRALRSWTFAGFPVGETIYGHFRFNGRTRATYSFGTARPPCGTLSRRAPRLPVRKVLEGRWTMQLDTEPDYSRFTDPRIVDTTRVFLTVRPRPAASASVFTSGLGARPEIPATR
jgi:hypothetical protein